MLFCQGGWVPAGMNGDVALPASKRPTTRGDQVLASADKAARNGLSDRYERKNQTFRHMPNSLPNPPSFAAEIGWEGLHKRLQFNVAIEFAR